MSKNQSFESEEIKIPKYQESVWLGLSSVALWAAPWFAYIATFSSIKEPSKQPEQIPKATEPKVELVTTKVEQPLANLTEEVSTKWRDYHAKREGQREVAAKDSFTPTP